MEEHSDIISKLIKRKKPDLPENFFENFHGKLLSDLSAENELDEFVLPKTKTPTVPVAFFSNFYQNLQAEIESENAFADLKIAKSKKPEVPANFESEFRKNLMSKIHPKQSRGRIIKITFWSTAAAIAAGLTLLFTLQSEQPIDQTKTLTETKSETVDEETLDTYVAYLDEESLVDYIIENDIDMGQTEVESDDVFDYVSSDIEDIYLDL